MSPVIRYKRPGLYSAVEIQSHSLTILVGQPQGKPLGSEIRFCCVNKHKMYIIMLLLLGCFIPNRLIGPVVKASAWRVGDQGFDSHLRCGIFVGQVIPVT